MKKRVFAWIMVFMMALTGIPVFGEGEKPEVVPLVSSETEMVSETPTVSATGEPMLDTAVSPEPTVVPETTVEPEKSVVPEVTVEPEASATPEPEISVSPDVPNESEVATAGEAAPEGLCQAHGKRAGLCERRRGGCVWRAVKRCCVCDSPGECAHGNRVCDGEWRGNGFRFGKGGKADERRRDCFL